jgi:hypothetical protein
MSTIIQIQSGVAVAPRERLEISRLHGVINLEPFMAKVNSVAGGEDTLFEAESVVFKGYDAGTNCFILRPVLNTDEERQVIPFRDIPIFGKQIHDPPAPQDNGQAVSARAPVFDREALLALRPKFERVEVPEFGCAVHVREWSGRERADWESWAAEDHASIETLVRMVIQGVCDDSGQPIFNDDDAEAVGEMPAEGLLRVARAVMRINALTADETDALVKNSNGDPNG